MLQYFQRQNILKISKNIRFMLTKTFQSKQDDWEEYLESLGVMVKIKLGLIMIKKRIAYDLLKLHQARALRIPSPHLLQLHQKAYNLMSDMIIDIKKPFLNICIHGKYPQMILPIIEDHNNKFNIAKKDVNITLVDHMRNEDMERLFEEGRVKEVRYVDNGDSWVFQEDSYDLLLSSLRTHHANSQEELFRKYLKTLKPDGALIGSTISEGTLSQLYWSYLMAENERYGGMSPKVLQPPSLGELGSALTMAKYKLVTILAHDEILQFQSVVDLVTLLQQMGESGYLRGRRKGVYKDLLLAASALYTAQFGLENNNVRATLGLSKFIAWKYHEQQPKSLSRGPHVGSVQFSEQLRKFGDEVQTFVIQQGSQAKRLK